MIQLEGVRMSSTVAGAYARGDRELAAALHVLESPLLWERVAGYVGTFGERSIDFGALFDEPWSTGERAMLQAAAICWGAEVMGEAGEPLSALLFTLSDEHVDRVLEAILIRKGRLRG